MKKKKTEYGMLCVGSEEQLFNEAVAIADRERTKAAGEEFTWALTGGSTPAAFYRHCVSKKAISPELAAAALWFTSDERMVPLESEESNFGNAARMLLDPLAIPAERRIPWPVDHEPEQAAVVFNDLWRSRFSDQRCFDLCFLGMGDDCHTASIFPRSPLIGGGPDEFFAHVDVPGKGPRLTVTRAGLAKCGAIVVMVTGAKKATPLSLVFQELYDPELRPVQLLREHSDRVTWLVDDAAAAEL